MSAGLFGVVVAGRLVQTDFQQVEPTKFLLNIPNPESVNHVTVFMTGVQPFPDGFGATVYFNMPNLDGSSNWHYLGYISNEKPSAIFKISKSKQANGDAHAFSSMMANCGLLCPTTNVVVLGQMGVSVEPLAEIQFMDSGVTQKAAMATLAAADAFSEFAKKMLESFYNYATSFANGGSTGGAGIGEPSFPVRTLEQWFNNFHRKLQQNPNFWKSQNSA